MQFLWRIFAVTLAVALASCSGESARGTAPAGLPQLEAAKKVNVTLRIRIPRKPHRGRQLRRPEYVSVATQSIAITAMDENGGQSRTFNQDLTPASNPHCNPATLICTIALPLKVGTYTLSFATFDGLLASGQPTGNELSANQDIPLTVSTGRQNTVTVSLQGIPTSIVIEPSATSTLGGTAANGYTLSKCSASPQTVNVFGADADGNVIVGAGSPTASLTSDNPAQLTVATSKLSPNQFVLKPPTPPLYPNSSIPVNLRVHETPGAQSGGSVQTLNTTLTYEGSICGVMTEFTVPTPFSQPYGITVGPDGAIWFAENGANKIGRIPITATTTNPQITEYAIPTSDSHPLAIVSGADGALWFTECYPGNIARMPTSGSPVLEFGIPTPNSAPQAIAAGSDGAIWFTESKTDKVGRIPVNGSPITEFPIPTAASDPFGGLTSGPDGALWFGESLGNNIGRIPTSGTPVTEYPIPSPTAFPRAITAGPDGAIWFTENDVNKIGRISTSGLPITEFHLLPTMVGPVAITAGPDDALYFTYSIGNSIGRIPTSGSPVTNYPIPTASSNSIGIVLGPDGALWFTEFNTNKIGRLQ